MSTMGAESGSLPASTPNPITRSSWTLSSSLDAAFCVWALEEALARGRPEVFNTDQGVQFTSEGFMGLPESRGIAIRMDGRGRVFDNIFSEPLWRTVKYEEVYLKDYADPREAREGLRAYFRFYNKQRPHQTLDYRTPAEVYEGRAGGERDRAAARTVARTGHPTGSFRSSNRRTVRPS